MDRSRLNRIRNKYWNAFKHATTRKGLDRQDEEVIQQFDDAVNDHVLYLGWHDYMLATTSLPVEAQVFQMWYFALYPQKISQPSAVDQAVQWFGKINEVPRAEAKRRLRIVIEDVRQTWPELMSDPMTENRPLLLGVEL